MLQKITALRHQLHSLAEPSGKEIRTKQALMDFLRENTTLEICPCGEGFYAAHREEGSAPGIAIRADYDALVLSDGSCSHRCGHDGHAAALCGAALYAEGKTFGRSIFFLFQPAEETGAGAEPCTELFEKENVGEIYGCHNLPGFPFGQVLTRPGTFACGSRGVTVRFVGKPTHAGYPELGISPAGAVGRLLCAVENLCAPENYRGMTLCTVIGAHMGEKTFGAAAAEAELWLTIRAEQNRDLEALYAALEETAEKLAQEYRLGLSLQTQDVFPATENDASCAAKVLELCGGAVLEVPMRWSEDFGQYLLKKAGAFFGIGAGTDFPGLHTETYEYPDALLEPAVAAFIRLMEG